MPVVGGFPDGAVVKNLPANAGDSGDRLELEMATHPNFLPGKSYGQRSCVDCGPQGHKESDRTEHTHV